MLIIDDDDNDRILMQRALRARGLRDISEATDGEEAVDLLARWENDAAAARPGLLLLDLRLPQKDGFEVLRWLRRRPSWLSTPVIVLTNSDAAEDVRRAHELGCNAYVVKPTDPAETMSLAGTIREFWMRYHRLGE
ncbi:MAG TPA: response regulator [Opitutaceae bacterium]|nr:response regulator [Opitutaceae bacterium]